jgi:hypothetical protein
MTMTCRLFFHGLGLCLPVKTVIHPEPDLQPPDQPLDGVLHLGVAEAVEEGEQDPLNITHVQI